MLLVAPIVVGVLQVRRRLRTHITKKRAMRLSTSARLEMRIHCLLLFDLPEEGAAGAYVGLRRFHLRGKSAVGSRVGILVMEGALEESDTVSLVGSTLGPEELKGVGA